VGISLVERQAGPCLLRLFPRCVRKSMISVSTCVRVCCGFECPRTLWDDEGAERTSAGQGATIEGAWFSSVTPGHCPPLGQNCDWRSNMTESTPFGGCSVSSEPSSSPADEKCSKLPFPAAAASMIRSHGVLAPKATLHCSHARALANRRSPISILFSHATTDAIE
jgi:hypothetical protein